MKLLRNGLILLNFALIPYTHAQMVGSIFSPCDRSIGTDVISTCALPPCWYRSQEIGVAVAHVNTVPAYLPIPADACSETQDAKLVPTQLPISSGGRFLENSRNSIRPNSISADIQRSVTLPGDVVYYYKKWVLVPAPHCLNPFNSSIVTAGSPLVTYSASRATAPATCNDNYRINSVCMYNAGFNPVLGNYETCEDNTNGSCGSAHNTAVSSAPNGGSLCSSGTASVVTGSGPWNWTCNGSGSIASSANCSASRLINGTCGSSNNATLSSVPTTNLCSAGTPTMVAGSGPWNWSCTGSGTNATSENCSAQAASTCKIKHQNGLIFVSFNTYNSNKAICDALNNGDFSLQTHTWCNTAKNNTSYNCLDTMGGICNASGCSDGYKVTCDCSNNSNPGPSNNGNCSPAGSGWRWDGSAWDTFGKVSDGWNSASVNYVKGVGQAPGKITEPLILPKGIIQRNSSHLYAGGRIGDILYCASDTIGTWTWDGGYGYCPAQGNLNGPNDFNCTASEGGECNKAIHTEACRGQKQNGPYSHTCRELRCN